MASALVYGQDQVPSSNTEMHKLDNLIGHWRGEGWMQQGNNRSNFSQTEHVQTKLNGTTLLIEGNGYSGDSLIFQAMAVASFDQESDKYRFNSFLADGKYVEATGFFNDDSSFTWQFDVPGGKVKYNIVFTSTTWREKGYYKAAAGDQWYNFLEMNLTKTQ